MQSNWWRVDPAEVYALDSPEGERQICLALEPQGLLWSSPPRRRRIQGWPGSRRALMVALPRTSLFWQRHRVRDQMNNRGHGICQRRGLSAVPVEKENLNWTT